MANTTKIPLVSSEIAGIWNSYIGESTLRCLLKYFSNRVDDNKTFSLLQDTLNASNQHIEVLRNLLVQEKLPIPEGVSDNDINIHAPRLYTDTFYLQYLSYTSMVAMYNYSFTLNQVARTDIRDYFSKCISESVDLYNKSSELKLSKGIFVRAPYVEVPKEVQYIQDKSFMSDLFGKKRSLLASEATHIFFIVFTTMIRKSLLTGFLQVSKDKNISNYISKVLTAATKQNDKLASILTDEGIPLPSASDSHVTDSIIAPFSEKLMLNKIMILYTTKIENLGLVLANSMRSDLHNIYTEFISEAIKYSQMGADIMIDNKWFEQPPQVINHENLVKI